MTEAGWYNDDADPTLARWHDGTSWTEHTMVKGDWKGPGSPPPPAMPMQPAFGQPPPSVRAARADGKAEQARAKAMRPWWKKKRFVIPGLVLVAAGIGAAAGGGDDDDPVATEDRAESRSTSGTEVETPTTADPFANETASQQQARRKAGDYLDFSSFSRTGLIKQLEFEGFSEADATYGVDAQGADWNAQAAKKAAEYLEMSSFSRSGLVDQLVFEGFTPEEAEYGVSTTGL